MAGLCLASCMLSGLVLCPMPADVPNNVAEGHGSRADQT